MAATTVRRRLTEVERAERVEALTTAERHRALAADIGELVNRRAALRARAAPAHVHRCRPDSSMQVVERVEISEQDQLLGCAKRLRTQS